MFVGPNATFTNDPLPAQPPVARRVPAHDRPRRRLDRRQRDDPARASRSASGAMVGAGAVVTRSVPPNAIVVGNPARIIGYAEPRQRRAPREPRRAGAERAGHASSRSAACTCTASPSFADLRGSLDRRRASSDGRAVRRRSAASWSTTCRRREVRGEHAHRELPPVPGLRPRPRAASSSTTASTAREVLLDGPTIGHLPAADGLGARSTATTPDAVLLVLRVPRLRRRRLHPRLRRLSRRVVCLAMAVEIEKAQPAGAGVNEFAAEPVVIEARGIEKSFQHRQPQSRLAEGAADHLLASRLQGAARAARRLLRRAPGRVLRDRRPQRLRQEHAAEDPRQHLPRRRGHGADGRPAGALHRARGRLQPGADGARERRAERGDDGPAPPRGASSASARSSSSPSSRSSST